MSRGFVKEGDQEEVPLVTPRAFLPAGVENFVTSAGLAALLEEREALLSERHPYEGVDNNDARVQKNYLTAKLRLLEDRIRTARVLDFDPKRQKSIAFGANVEYKELGSGKTSRFQIVGVDEANIEQGKISFLSPMSKALMNKKKGDVVTVRTPRRELQIEIISIQ
jgi:Transcription elongation factor